MADPAVGQPKFEEELLRFARQAEQKEELDWKTLIKKDENFDPFDGLYGHRQGTIRLPSTHQPDDNSQALHVDSDTLSAEHNSSSQHAPSAHPSSLAQQTLSAQHTPSKHDTGQAGTKKEPSDPSDKLLRDLKFSVSPRLHQREVNSQALLRQGESAQNPPSAHHISPAQSTSINDFNHHQDSAQCTLGDWTTCSTLKAMNPTRYRSHLRMARGEQTVEQPTAASSHPPSLQHPAVEQPPIIISSGEESSEEGF